MDIIGKIEKLRKERGWTIYKLALESGITQSTISNMYARGTLPSLTTLENVCVAFGITMAQFFDDMSEKELTQEEYGIIAEYRKLGEVERTAVKNLIYGLTKKN